MPIDQVHMWCFFKKHIEIKAKEPAAGESKPSEEKEAAEAEIIDSPEKQPYTGKKRGRPRKQGRLLCM